MLSNVFTQLENSPRYKHSAAIRKAHVLRCSLCHTAPHSLPQAPLLSQSQVLPMHFPGRLSTPLRAHTDLLPTWKSHGKLSPPVQILSAHIVTQAKQGLNSTSIQGSTAHHLLVQLPRTDSSFSTCRCPCCSLHSSLELDELLRELDLCYISSNYMPTALVTHTCQHAPRCTLLPSYTDMLLYTLVKLYCTHQLHYHH